MNILTALSLISSFLIFIYAEGCRDRPSEKFLKVKQLISRNAGHYLVLYEVGRDCSVLLENDAEILRTLFKTKAYDTLTHLVLISCSGNENIFENAAEIASLQDDCCEALTVLSNKISIYDTYAQQYIKYIFGSALRHKSVKFLVLESHNRYLCKFTDKEGRNALHLAAIYDAPEIFNITKHCKLLINQKDFKGNYPMEYVSSEETASEFNQKWLEVAKERYLSLETALKRLEMCSKFNLEDVSDEREIVKGTYFKEAFEAGITDVEDIYCPYLKMKLNLLKGKGRDSSGLIFEWLSFLLSDIFGPFVELEHTTETIANFQVSFFKSTAAGDLIPTGFYDDNTYEFVGKVLSVSNYFGLGMNYKIIEPSNEQKSSGFVAIQRGLDALQFIRIEIHRINDNDEYVLKSHNNFIVLKFEVKSSRYKGFDTETYKLLRAFKSLSDNQKMRLISLVSDDVTNNGVEKGPITFSIVKSTGSNEPPKIIRNKIKIELNSFSKTSYYKDTLLELIK